MDEEHERVVSKLAHMLWYCEHVQTPEHAEQVVKHILTAAGAEGYRLVRVL